MSQFGGIYKNRKVLVTGDTGFKGSWLTFWLLGLGADVAGVSLPSNTSPNHWDILHMDYPAYRGDIRDAEFVRKGIQEFQPEIVFHMAAQPLVRRSYRDPLETWSTNVMGTANVLEACRMIDSLQAIVTVTTDKVYANREWTWGYRETDALGGHDPYSASKACTELLVDSYRSSFFKSGKALIATVRAGNVIGGGDWAEDRLVPDLVRAAVNKNALEIRSPNSTRPWQHVLECLTGYLLVGQKLLSGENDTACAWNFGPDASDNRRVIEVLELLLVHWSNLKWTITAAPQPHEATQLYLDNSRAKATLKWRPVWSLDEAVEHTATWYRDYYDSGIASTATQLNRFTQDAKKIGMPWAS